MASKITPAHTEGNASARANIMVDIGHDQTYDLGILSWGFGGAAFKTGTAFLNSWLQLSP